MITKKREVLYIINKEEANAVMDERLQVFNWSKGNYKYETVYDNNLSIEAGSEIQFDFMGFNRWEDFYTIINIIDREINPDKIGYRGVDDISGQFEKDGLSVAVEFNKIKGNSLVYKCDNDDESFTKVSGWAKLIFDEMMRSV